MFGGYSTAIHISGNSGLNNGLKRKGNKDGTMQGMRRAGDSNQKRRFMPAVSKKKNVVLPGQEEIRLRRMREDVLHGCPVFIKNREAILVPLLTPFRAPA